MQIIEFIQGILYLVVGVFIGIPLLLWTAFVRILNGVAPFGL